jgi:hypothetical protein
MGMFYHNQLLLLLATHNNKHTTLAPGAQTKGCARLGDKKKHTLTHTQSMSSAYFPFGSRQPDEREARNTSQMGRTQSHTPHWCQEVNWPIESWTAQWSPNYVTLVTGEGQSVSYDSGVTVLASVPNGTLFST